MAVARAHHCVVIRLTEVGTTTADQDEEAAESRVAYDGVERKT